MTLDTPSIGYPDYSGFPPESSHTAPSQFCTVPCFWHAADGDSTEFEVLELVAAFVRALQPETVLETGSAFGFGSAMIGRALLSNGHGMLYSLEANQARSEVAKRRVESLPVQIICADSHDWLPPKADVGFAFFDSGLETRGAEFVRYRPFMVEGAIVAFHDTGPQHPVRTDIKKLEDQGLVKVINLRTPRGIAFGEVL